MPNTAMSGRFFLCSAGHLFSDLWFNKVPCFTMLPTWSPSCQLNVHFLGVLLFILSQGICLQIYGIPLVTFFVTFNIYLKSSGCYGNVPNFVYVNNKKQVCENSWTIFQVKVLLSVQYACLHIDHEFSGCCCLNITTLSIKWAD